MLVLPDPVGRRDLHRLAGRSPSLYPLGAIECHHNDSN